MTIFAFMDRSGSRNPNWKGGAFSHPLYWVYKDMVYRCKRESHPRYKDYGARGISVCPQWEEDFWVFVEDMGPRPEGKRNGRSLYSLERVDNNGNYEPGNVVWGTYHQQANNKRGFGHPEDRRDPVTGQFSSDWRTA